jgi:4-hydroxy-tetrahydrodipicolinate synthase
MEVITIQPGRPARTSRRQFLRILGAGAICLTLPSCESGSSTASRSPLSGPKPLRGIFPIAQTPFTRSDQLDLAALVEEVKFIDRGDVHGFVWPQLASEWMTLSESERMAGMEAIGSTGKGLRPAIVLGVQGADIEAVKRYVKQAERVGADAIISLPPAETTDNKAILAYYQQVGGSTHLPLFVQAVGNMDVELLLEMYRTIPTMRYIKDEAGDPLTHVKALNEGSSGQIRLFSGGHGRRLIEEMTAGFSGSMPAASLADMYAQTFDLWQAGKQDQARAMQERTLKALAEMLRYGQEGMKFVLCERGVFKTYSARAQQPKAFASAAAVASGSNTRPLDEDGRKLLHEMVQSLRPYFKA